MSTQAKCPHLNAGMLSEQVVCNGLRESMLLLMETSHHYRFLLQNETPYVLCCYQKRMAVKNKQLVFSYE